MRGRGGYIGASVTPAASATNSAAGGVWTLREAESLKRAATWPRNGGLPEVGLLLQMEGSGSTFVDSSLTPKTVTAYFGATQTTALAKAGLKSMFLSGTTFGSAPYISVPYSSDFDLSNGDWTVECWAYLTNRDNTRNLFAINNAPGQYAQVTVVANQDGSAYLLTQGTSGDWLDTSLAAAGTIRTGAWQHVAAVRNGSSFRLYVDGTSVISFTSSSSLNNTSGISTIGTRVGVGNGIVGSTTWQGYIDDFRATKGIARYSGSTFAVPTEAF